MLDFVYVPRIGVCKDSLHIRPTSKEHETTEFWNRTARVSLPPDSDITEFEIDVVELEESPTQVGGTTELSTDIA